MESSNHLRALAHPVRLRILSLLTGADLTAADVARELGITHANASYHLRLPARRRRDRGRAARRRSAAAGPALPPPLARGGPPAHRAGAADPEAATTCRARRPRGAAAPAPDPPPRGRQGWSPMPSCGSRRRPGSGPGPARGGLRPAARRRPPAPHRGHRAGEPLAVRVRHGRPVSAGTSLGPLRQPGVRLVPRLAHRQPARADRRLGGDGLRRARPRGVGDRPSARCWPPAPCRWCWCCSSGACSPTGSPARWCCRSRTSPTRPPRAPPPCCSSPATPSCGCPAPPGGGRRGVRCGVPGDGRAWCPRSSRASSCSRPTPCSARPAGLTAIAGPSLGTLLVVTVGSGWAVLADAATWLVAASCCYRCAAMRRPVPRPRPAATRRHRRSPSCARAGGCSGTPPGSGWSSRGSACSTRSPRGVADPRPGAGRRDDRPPGLGVGALGRGRGALVATRVLCASPCPGRSWSAWSAPRCSASPW